MHIDKYIKKLVGCDLLLLFFAFFSSICCSSNRNCQFTPPTLPKSTPNSPSPLRMGSGQSVGMAGFSLMTEEDYDALSFPSTPPPYRAAMELAAKFGEIDLGVSASSPSSAPICEGCGRSLGARKRILSLDETEPVEESKENQQEDSKEEGEKSGGS